MRPGVVTPIRNQGTCGSCYTFATIAAVEGAVAIKTGVSTGWLSAQQVLDCSGPQGNQGCGGGGLGSSFSYMTNAGGLCADAAYPYTGAQTSCRDSSCTKVAQVKSTGFVAPGSQTALEAAVRQGPVTVAVAAGTTVWQLYKSGIINVCDSALDHAVLLVGYDVDKVTGVPYYRLKNQWGGSWGESGYVRVGRGATCAGNGASGVQMEPVFPIV